MIKQVLGIDPAPSKKSTVYDGEGFHHFSAKELRDFLHKPKKEEVLICWDAPLTGPADLHEGSFSMRDIERVLAAEIWEAGVKGVSIRPYSGCSHWAISRSILGLPKVGKYDSDDIPFPLTFDQSFEGSASTEVHPAVAMYLWLNQGFRKYKGNSKAIENRAAVQQNVQQLMTIKELKPFNPAQELSSDDELDAFVAWLLGTLWLRGKRVELLGDEKTGAMLLPFKDIYTKADKALIELRDKKSKGKR